MRQWTIEKPQQLTFDAVRKLNVRIVAGRLAVLASDGPPTLEVADVGNPPLIVTHEDDGTLTVAYKDLTWEGLLGWLRPGRREITLTLTVPKECPVNAGVVSASAVGDFLVIGIGDGRALVHLAQAVDRACVEQHR